MNRLAAAEGAYWRRSLSLSRCECSSPRQPLPSSSGRRPTNSSSNSRSNKHRRSRHSSFRRRSGTGPLVLPRRLSPSLRSRSSRPRRSRTRRWGGSRRWCPPSTATAPSPCFGRRRPSAKTTTPRAQTRNRRTACSTSLTTLCTPWCAAEPRLRCCSRSLTRVFAPRLRSLPRWSRGSGRWTRMWPTSGRAILPFDGSAIGIALEK
mmetsp:Transcript_34295/g.62755  ORF Transcript_34295/g.62755 Transcript_34295/m.62755 type:complete len:206 (+) Transcript_34295:95-712(+)